MKAPHGLAADPVGPYGDALGDAHDVELDRRDVRGDTRLCADVVRQLEQAVPDGWAVSTGCLWSPVHPGARVLQPDVAVHRSAPPDGGLTEPPTLCVSIAAGRSDDRAARLYARSGVDHYWHLDSRSGLLEVFVRVDDDYRHAESVIISSPAHHAAGQPAAPWVDFGIGVVELTLGTDPWPHSGGPTVA